MRTEHHRTLNPNCLVSLNYILPPPANENRWILPTNDNLPVWCLRLAIETFSWLVDSAVLAATLHAPSKRSKVSPSLPTETSFAAAAMPFTQAPLLPALPR